MSTDQQDDVEVWISQVHGGTTINIPNVETGKTRSLRVAGKGQVLRVTTQQREIFEDQYRDKDRSPFRNGRLYKRDAEQQLSTQAVEDEGLALLFELDEDDFQSEVRNLSETNVRRLKDLSKENNAGVQYVQFLDDYIAEQWPIGGDTPSYRESKRDPIE